MELLWRSASDADLGIVQEIANANLLTLNPNDKRIGDIEAREMIRGFFDPGIAQLTKHPAAEQWQGFVTLNPDASRRRFFLDIYTRPGAPTLADSLQLALDLAREHAPDFQLWIGAHANDGPFKALLERRGFALIRRYWTLEMDLPGGPHGDARSTGTIREIDLDNEVDLRAYHEVHQDSFSTHFGFVPRAFESWCDLVFRDRAESNMRVWIIAVGGQDVGFIDGTDELAHEDAGYVSGLGVRHAFHGQGLGSDLLRHAIHHYSGLGFKKLCLNVDAGNESGALRLYESVGMRPFSEWHHHENQNWSANAD